MCRSVALAAGVLAIPAASLPVWAGPLVLAPQDSPPAAAPAPAAAPTSAPAAAPTSAHCGGPRGPAGRTADTASSPAAPAQSRDDIRVHNFKGQTYDQILDWFSRMTGLPVVREVPVPAGTVDYIYPGEYTVSEALHTLNILLRRRA